MACGCQQTQYKQTPFGGYTATGQTPCHCKHKHWQIGLIVLLAVIVAYCFGSR